MLEMTHTDEEVRVHARVGRFGAHRGVRCPVARARRRAGLSQGELAGVELSASYVSLLESGRRNPTTETLEILAGRLGCTVEYLVNGQDAEQADRLKLALSYADLALRNGEPADALTQLTALTTAHPDLGADDKLRVRRLRAKALEGLGEPRGGAARDRGPARAGAARPVGTTSTSGSPSTPCAATRRSATSRTHSTSARPRSQPCAAGGCSGPRRTPSWPRPCSAPTTSAATWCAPSTWPPRCSRSSARRAHPRPAPRSTGTRAWWPSSATTCRRR